MCFPSADPCKNIFSICAYIGITLIFLLCLMITMSQGNALDPCNAVKFPDVAASGMTVDDCSAYLKAAIPLAPAEQQNGLGNLLFVWSFSSRIEACTFLAVIGSAVYTVAVVKFSSMHPILCMYFFFGLACMMVDANHAGLLGFGTNPMVTPEAAAGGGVFVVVWGVILPFLLIGWVGSLMADIKKAGMPQL
jgi:hypothetical protein